MIEHLASYKALLQAYPDDCVLLVDGQKCILIAVGRLLHVLFPTITPSALQPLADVWHGDLMETAAPFLQQSMSGAQTEWRYYASNRVLGFKASPVMFAGCEPLVLILVNDKTEKLRHLEVLRSDAERYRAIVEDNIELICRFTPDGVLTFVNGAMCSYTHKEPTDLIGTSFYRLMIDTDVLLIQRAIQNLSVDNPNAVIELYVRSFGTKQQWIRWSFHAIGDAGGHIAEVQSVGYDITDRVRAQAIEKKQRNLAEALRNIASLLNSTLDLKQVLENIIDIIDLVVLYDTVNVMLVDDAYATVVRGRGYTEHNIKGVLSLRLRIRRVKHLRTMLETRREMVIPNMQHQDNLCADVPELCWVQSYAGAPIVSEGQVIGFLNLESRSPDFFEPEHGRLVRAFADHAATAIRNAQLFEQAQRIAVIEERQRLARELHDAVSQTLFSANMIADALPLLAEKQPQAIPDQIKLLRQQTQLAMAELRAMLYELRPQSLADTDIKTLLEQLVHVFTNRTTMQVNLSLAGEMNTAIQLDVKVVLYRIAQEAINNAIQHATATRANIALTLEAAQFRLSIVDNGQGFEPGQQRMGNMGLRIMRERAESIGANLQIASSPGHGTEIILLYKPEG